MKKLLAYFLLIFALILSFNFKSGEAFAYEEHTGELKNIAVCVEFSSADEIRPTRNSDLSRLNEVFNGYSDSLKAFINKNSQGKLAINTEFTKVVRLDRPSSYFMPRYEEKGSLYEEINPDGYDNRKYTQDGEVSVSGALTSAEYIFREHEFVSLVLKALKDYDISGVDNDGDGYIDGLTIVPLGGVEVNLTDSEDWGALFWPHMATRFYGEAKDVADYYYVGDKEFTFERVPFCNKSVYRYVIAPFSAVCEGGEKGLTVLCHEFMHILGAPDYYSYDSGDEYVGEFDIMGTAETPTLSLTYLRERMGWTDEGEVLAVEESGEYFLSPVESSGAGDVKAYKIVLSDYFETGDSYYIECRDLGGVNEGIIIYRVNEKNGFIVKSGGYGNEELGNIYGSPEVYIFRREGIGAGKDLKKNAFLDSYLYKKFGSESGIKNLITTSGGQNTKITVEVVKKTGNGYKLRVTIPESPQGDISLGATAEIKSDLKGRNYLAFENSYRKGYAYVLTYDEEIKGLTAEEIISGEYGEAEKIPVSFQKCYLPKADGVVNVYVCFSNGEQSSAVTHLSYGTKPFKISYEVIIVGGAVGLAVFLSIVISLKFLAKKRRGD